MTVKNHQRKHSLGWRIGSKGIGLPIGSNSIARRIGSSPAALAALMLGCIFLASTNPSPASAATATNPTKTGTTVTTAAGGSSLEAAATKAGEMGRKVAMSLIGLALAVGGVVLVFRRDFKKVAGVLVLGLLAILLATPAGIGVLQNTVTSLFGS
ncbi:MAG TPA: hypothetical protein VIC06_09415 [Solirubrobacteraceae bacterium]|jgi:hypothetical protein